MDGRRPHRWGLSWELAFSPLTGAISVTGGTIGGALAGAIGGYVTGRTLQHTGLPVATDRMITVAVGWTAGGGVGALLSWAYFGYTDITAVAVAGAVTGAVIGTIGGGLMFFELSHLRQTARPLRS